jgi:hypothetical protein
MPLVPVPLVPEPLLPDPVCATARPMHAKRDAVAVAMAAFLCIFRM